MPIRIIIFLIINFGALGLGGLFTEKGVQSEWSNNLVKAPWTPPGWVFGAAWSLIMICLSFYMAYLWNLATDKKLLIGLFALQWILNVSWNPVFFHYHNVPGALIIIIALMLLVGFMLFYYRPVLQVASLLLAPYLIWLVIATSLNLYILIKN